MSLIINRMERPVGEMKKLVSLVDRSDFDNYVYPSNETNTKFQPVHKPYYQYASDIVTMPFTGNPEWGKRITFSLPWPWQGDFLNWVILRLKPLSWINPILFQKFLPNCSEQYTILNYPPEYDDYNKFYVWANSLGTTAIQYVEMEVQGVIVEQFSGDWITVYNRMFHTVSNGLPYDDALYGREPRYQQPTLNNLLPTEDGYVYAFLPFWFTKYVNAALPLCSIRGPNTVRFHITLRPFQEVIRKIGTPLTCGETPLNKTFRYSEPNGDFNSFKTNSVVPLFEAVDMIVGISHVETKLRNAYVEQSHELMMNPVQEIVFNEPLKYLVNRVVDGQDIQVQLPVQTNGPIKQIIWFLRRKAAIEQYNDRLNFSATINPDIVWNPEIPLLRRASLLIGTAVWANEDEKWWRQQGNLPLPGGVRGYGDFIYAYNFADSPSQFNPSGNINASRTDISLNLTVNPPGDEWSVTVFVVGTNWMRFENGIANVVFSD
jgi:hypothetical protein